MYAALGKKFADAVQHVPVDFIRVVLYPAFFCDDLAVRAFDFGTKGTFFVKQHYFCDVGALVDGKYVMLVWHNRQELLAILIKTDIAI